MNMGNRFKPRICNSAHVKDGKVHTTRNSRTEALAAMESAGYAGYMHFRDNRVHWYNLPLLHYHNLRVN